MQIDIKGRNVPVTDELRTHAEKRLTKVARQVSDLARLEIEIFKEPNPRVADCHVAEGTLYLKGVTLRASDASPDMLHSLNLMVDELARQVKRHRDKLRHRREAHAIATRAAMRAASPVIVAEALRPATEGFAGPPGLI
ncbi:MAG: ribosome-associated translation inhibitor RaiA [Solirubrobacteraceae bacterium]|jgi:putative sigma-54 modulation protein